MQIVESTLNLFAQFKKSAIALRQRTKHETAFSDLIR